MRRAKILFLTSGRHIPSSRFRVHAFLPRLREDFRPTVVPCIPNKYASKWLTPAKMMSRLVSVLRSPFHDLVFVERELLPYLTPHFERMTSWLNPAVHFDLDDAIHLKYGDPNPVGKAMALASGVTAGNEWLARFARLHNDNVTVVPTVVDTEKFATAGEGDVPLVWSGTPSNLPFLEEIAPALRRLPDARILVVCNTPPPDLGIPTEFVRWNERVEVDAIRRGRIGLMPLPDEDWSRGKCGLKLLQYMACGLPAVSSPVGVNSEIAEGGEAALLASSENEWVEALTRLLSDADLRRKIGARGRARADGVYSVRAVYPRLRDALIGSLQRSTGKSRPE